MDEFSDISKRLTKQLDRFEKNASNTADRLKGVEFYINKKLEKARELLPDMEGSKNWMSKLSRIIDILEEVQRVLDRMDDVEAIVEPSDEVFMDMESLSDGFSFANF